MDAHLFELLQRSTLAHVHSSLLRFSLTNAQTCALASAFQTQAAAQQLVPLFAQTSAGSCPTPTQPTSSLLATSATPEKNNHGTNAAQSHSSTSFASTLASLPYPIASDVAKLSVQDIAKEAMRITKEANRKQQEQSNSAQGDAASGSATSNSSPNQGHSPEALSILACGGNTCSSNNANATIFRLNKFVRRLYDMVKAEQDKGVVEWRRGLLVLHSTATFAKHILPKFFNTRNFKTFRRQLNYYGFVHVRSFSNTAAATTTALWVHQELAAAVHNNGDAGSSNTATINNKSITIGDPDDLGLILTLRRVEPNEDHKTVEGRRQRKVMALNTVEEDLQVSTSLLQRQQIQSLLNFVGSNGMTSSSSSNATATPVATPVTPTTALVPRSDIAPAVALAEPSSSYAPMEVDPHQEQPTLVPTPPAIEEQSRAPMIISVPVQTHEVHIRIHQDTLGEEGPEDEVSVGLALDTDEPDTTGAAPGAASAPTCCAAISDTTSVSSNGNNSVCLVSESDEEVLQQQSRPPKTEKSAANLLLLLSQGIPATCVTVR
ncbi:hypothetical protein ACA910_021304 [Epithemia clementina (nom. ined.)]